MPANVHFRSSPVLVFRTNDNIELESFDAVAIDERTDSEINNTKSKIEIEETSSLTNFKFFVLTFW